MIILYFRKNVYNILFNKKLRFYILAKTYGLNKVGLNRLFALILNSEQIE